MKIGEKVDDFTLPMTGDKGGIFVVGSAGSNYRPVFLSQG